MKNIWDFWANKYEKLWVQKYSLGPTRREILNGIKDIKLQNNIAILDMGCGTGQLLRDLSKYKNIALLHGVDYSQEMISVAKSKGGEIEYFNKSIFDFNEEDNYDVITCSHSFPYYEDKKKAVDIFHKALKKEGRLFLAQASENSFYDKLCMAVVKFTTTKAKYLSKEEVLEIIKYKFKVEEIVLIKEKWYMPSIILFRLEKV